MDETMELEGIGRRLNWARERADVGLSEAADAIGLEAVELDEVECGRRHPLAMEVAGLAVLYGVSADWLVGMSERMVRV